MKICVVISHVKLKHFHLIYPYIQFIRKMASKIFAGGAPILYFAQATLSPVYTCMSRTSELISILCPGHPGVPISYKQGLSLCVGLLRR